MFQHVETLTVDMLKGKAHDVLKMQLVKLSALKIVR